MWNKLIWLTVATIAIAFIISISQENEQGPSLNKGSQLKRQAMNVVMFERKLQNGKTMEVSAREVEETGGQVVRLKDFLLTQPGELTMSGTDAIYDRTSSILEVKNKVIVKRADGSQAILNGLTWNRLKDSGHTVNPVRLEEKDLGGIITSDKAEFSDEFTRIAFIGRVHAQIMQNILNP
jgi:hypothetical protein